MREETSTEAESLNRQKVRESGSQVKGRPPKGAGNILPLEQGEHAGRAGGRKVT